MSEGFTLGDVIRKARIARRWNQTRLGAEAAKFQLRARDVAINKSTVSKVEKDPYTSEFGTVWRLLTALNLKFSDVEKRVGHPFTDAIRQTGVPRSNTRNPGSQETIKKRDGRTLAASVGPHAPSDPISGASREDVRSMAAELLSIAAPAEQAARVDRPARATGTTGQHAPTHRATPPRARPAARKHRR